MSNERKVIASKRVAGKSHSNRSYRIELLDNGYIRATLVNVKTGEEAVILHVSKGAASVELTQISEEIGNLIPLARAMNSLDFH